MRVAEPDLTTCRWPPGARLLRREGRGPEPGRSLRAVVAIPARDEAARLGRCLAALADQRDAGGARLDRRAYATVLLVNNCADASAEVALAAAERLGLGVRVLVARLEGGTAHVGWARRLAMDVAAELLEGAGRAGDGVILSTDADSRVSPGWLAAGLGAIARGADAAAGPIDGEPEEYAALNRRCRRRCELQRAYGGLLERLATLVDPEPHDPWPRHFFECGASMAV